MSFRSTFFQRSRLSQANELSGIEPRTIDNQRCALHCYLFSGARLA